MELRVGQEHALTPVFISLSRAVVWLLEKIYFLPPWYSFLFVTETCAPWMLLSPALACLTLFASPRVSICVKRVLDTEIFVAHLCFLGWELICPSLVGCPDSLCPVPPVSGALVTACQVVSHLCANFTWYVFCLIVPFLLVSVQHSEREHIFSCSRQAFCVLPPQGSSHIALIVLSVLWALRVWARPFLCVSSTLHAVCHTIGAW